MPHLDTSLLGLMQTVADTCESYRAEDYVIDLDRWYDVHYSCVKGPGSNFIVAVFKDTTERKRQDQRQTYMLKLGEALRSSPNHAEIEKAVTAEALNFFEADRCFYSVVQSSSLAIHGDPVVVNDTDSSELANQGLPFSIVEKARSFLSIPVVKAGGVVGFLR